MELLGANLGRELARIQMRTYQGTMERNQIILSGALRQNLYSELQRLQDKYDPTALSNYEAEINRLAKQKDELIDANARIDEIWQWDRIEDAREALLKMRDELVNMTNPSPEAFDTYLQTLNDAAGSAVLDSSNLVGNTGQGRWSSRSEVLDNGGGLSTTLKYNFIGADHVIELDSGETLAPDFEERTYTGTMGTLNWDDLTVTNRSGDSVTFEDSLGNSYTGTLRTGGGGVEPAWLYSDFDAAGKARALEDIDAAMKRLLTVEREYHINEAILDAAQGQLDSKMQAVQSEYDRTLEEQTAAREAELNAITLRASLTEKSFALTSNVGAAFIEGMFLYEPPWEQKRGILDIVNNVKAFS